MIDPQTESAWREVWAAELAAQRSARLQKLAHSGVVERVPVRGGFRWQLIPRSRL